MPSESQNTVYSKCFLGGQVELVGAVRDVVTCLFEESYLQKKQAKYLEA